MIFDPASQRLVFMDRWFDVVRGSSSYHNAVLAYDPVTNVATVLKLNNWQALYSL
jgi:hypothetical protein